MKATGIVRRIDDLGRVVIPKEIRRTMRIETMEGGLRWFDIKRYGIEIIRRTMSSNGLPAEKTDVLTKDDERRAIQIPQKVRDAGCPANPRKAATATTPTE